MSGLIDTHAHLHDRAFDSDRTSVLTRARAAGLEAIVTVGTDRAENEAAVALAEAEPDIFATVGLHPHDAKDWDTHLREQLVAMARRDAVVAIGEIGLDYFRLLSPHADQQRAFHEQLETANELRLPVVVHVREANEPAASILAKWAPSATCGYPLGVLHCFAGDTALAMRYIQLGFLISIAGPVTYPKSDQTRSVAAAIPLESLVVETDAPYLPPQRWRGQRNEPEHILETAHYIAKLRGTDGDELLTICGENARRLFRLPVASATDGIPA